MTPSLIPKFEKCIFKDNPTAYKTVCSMYCIQNHQFWINFHNIPIDEFHTIHVLKPQILLIPIWWFLG